MKVIYAQKKNLIHTLSAILLVLLQNRNATSSVHDISPRS